MYVRKTLPGWIGVYRWIFATESNTKVLIFSCTLTECFGANSLQDVYESL